MDMLVRGSQIVPLVSELKLREWIEVECRPQKESKWEGMHTTGGRVIGQVHTDVYYKRRYHIEVLTLLNPDILEPYIILLGDIVWLRIMELSVPRPH